MSRRSYKQYCGLALALDIVGERWTLLIVRELSIGPRRYSDIQESLPGIGTSLLAERLKYLEKQGIAQRSYLPPPAASTVYELTEEGRALSAATLPLTAWGAARMRRPAKRGETVRVQWLMRYMNATCDPDRSRGVRETYEIRLPPGIFHVHADDGRLTFHDGSAREPELVIKTDLETFIGLGSEDADPAAAVASGRLHIQGNPAAGLRAFHILRPAGVAERSGLTS